MKNFKNVLVAAALLLSLSATSRASLDGTPSTGSFTVGTTANGLGTYSTADIFSPGALSWGVADGVIAAGSAVYGQINGGVTATVTGAQIGIALTTAGQAGDLIDWITLPQI